MITINSCNVPNETICVKRDLEDIQIMITDSDCAAQISISADSAHKLARALIKIAMETNGFIKVAMDAYVMDVEPNKNIKL